MDTENNVVGDTEFANSVCSHTNQVSTADANANSTERPSQDARYNDDCSTNSSSDSPSTPDRCVKYGSERNDTMVQDFRGLEIAEPLHIPIVGYEVMEERARFTIFKLKVEDSKSKKSWLVFRRYTDFVRLYSRIKAERPNANLPLPGKRWFRDNFEPVFLEERVRGLQVFVNSIVKRLPNHPRVREFFCLDEPPQVCNYQPEVQAVYGALEDSISSLKTQLKQKDATILYLQQRVADLEAAVGGCGDCSKKAC